MKTPSFWNSKNTLSTLLLPLAYVYNLIGIYYRSLTPCISVSVPVICIGNVNAGGAGKTPIALHIGQLLKDKKVNGFFLSRGYGGTCKKPMLVDHKIHSSDEVGDEPLLLSRVLPTIVAKDRAKGALLAIQKGAQLIVMDDGLQNPSLKKSLSFLVIDGKIGWGNGRIIPAGPLRESPQDALNRSHAIIVLNRSTAVASLPADKPVLYAKTLPTEEMAVLKGKKIFAFCGIAHPHKFYETLSATGASVIETRSFADHHKYSDKDIKKLLVDAHQHHAILVTTAKDAVRIPAAFAKSLFIFKITVEFDNPPLLEAIVDYTLSSSHEKI